MDINYHCDINIASNSDENNNINNNREPDYIALVLELEFLSQISGLPKRSQSCSLWEAKNGAFIRTVFYWSPYFLCVFSQILLDHGQVGYLPQVFRKSLHARVNVQKDVYLRKFSSWLS